MTRNSSFVESFRGAELEMRIIVFLIFQASTYLCLLCSSHSPAAAKDSTDLAKHPSLCLSFLKASISIISVWFFWSEYDDNIDKFLCRYLELWKMTWQFTLLEIELKEKKWPGTCMHYRFKLICLDFHQRCSVCAFNY